MLVSELKKKRRVFISHGLAEVSMARRLANSLAGMGIDVVEPSERIAAGDNFGSALAASLKSADGMVILLTPDAVNSPLLNQELTYALAHPRFKGRVVPVLARKTSDYPWILRHMHPVKFEGAVVSAAAEIAGRLRRNSRSAKKATPNRS